MYLQKLDHTQKSKAEIKKSQRFKILHLNYNFKREEIKVKHHSKVQKFLFLKMYKEKITVMKVRFGEKETNQFL